MIPRPSPIRRTLSEYRWSIAITYSLFALEMAGSLARPYFLGKAVDDLLIGETTGLLQLVSVHLAWLLVGMARQLVDTRTFSAIYTRFITSLFEKTSDELDISRRSAYSSLAREIVEFLQYDLVYVLEAAYNVFGSLVILLFYDRTVVLICAAALVPVGAFSLL